MEAKTILFGKGVILVKKDDFLQGVQDGQSTYDVASRVHLGSYSDMYLTELFLNHLEDMTRSSLYGIGWAIGWLNAFAGMSQQ